MNSLFVDIRLPLDRFELRVTFETQRRVTGIFGVSGSGKSSLIESLAGLRRGAIGGIRFAEHVWLDTTRRIFVKPEHRRVGYVAQDALLFPHLNVRDNLLAGAQRARRAGADTSRILENAVRVLELGPLLGSATDILSGGERQRVSLGRALCSAPHLLLLDEPLASVDIAMRWKVLHFLHRVREEFELPMLLVSHNPVDVVAICDDLIVLREGKMIARGDPRIVLTSPSVFPIAEHEGFENVLPVRVVEHRDHTTIVALSGATLAPLLHVPSIDAAPGSETLVGIAATDILLAISQPTGLSARNALRATVESVRSAGHAHLVTARLSPESPPISAEVTADAVNELCIREGMELWLVFKSAAVRVGE